MRRFKTLCIALWISISGCGERSPSVSHTVRDSAGVRVVENGSVEGARSDWRIPRRPIFRTGWEDDEPTFERIWAGLILPDGDVVVADYQGNRIFHFDSTGTLLRVIGRRGEGPGEFTSLESIVSVGRDSILAYDPRQRRVSLLVRGELTEEHRVERWGRFGYYFAGAIGDGSIVMVPTNHRASPRDSAGWVEAPVIRTTEAFSRFDTIAILPYAQLGTSNPLRKLGKTDLTGTRIAHARNDSPEIRWYGLRGQLEQVAKWEPVWRAFDDDLWEEYESAAREFYGGSPELNSERLNRVFESQKEAVEGPVPLFSDMHGDSEGNVWLGESVFPGTRPERYHVVGADGRWLGQVELPRPMRVLAIAEDRLLAIERDEWDIEAVSVYRIEKE